MVKTDLIRQQFPMLVQDPELVYLDNAATTLKPQCVIDAIQSFYSQRYGTVHRGVYWLCQQATQEYDTVRAQVQRFINAKSDREIVFTKGTTDAINLVANGAGNVWLSPGDEILITHTEHHANIIPWQQVCDQVGCTLVVAPVMANGHLDMVEFEKKLNHKTVLVAVGHISNALGVEHPVKQIIQLAHAVGAKVLVDGAQSIAHQAIDVQALDCDFFCFSSHKLYGPTGVGVLYGKKQWLDELPPYQYGGDMIDTVTFEKTTFAPPPMRFEAGTPPIAQVMGMGAAIDFIQGIGLSAIAEHESRLLAYAYDALKPCPGLRLVGEPNTGILSFTLDGIHPHDVGTILDSKGIAVRAGHHCAQPTMQLFNVSATTRASFGVYNTTADVDALLRGIQYVQSVMT